MKVCYLCGKENSLTGEHVWSNCVIQAFPSAPFTLDENRGKAYAAPPIVNALCNECNHKLSPCDAYMGDLTRTYFTKHLAGDHITLDLVQLFRWILKTSANHSVSLKRQNEWWRKYADFMISGSVR